MNAFEIRLALEELKLVPEAALVFEAAWKRSLVANIIVEVWIVLPITETDIGDTQLACVLRDTELLPPKLYFLSTDSARRLCRDCLS